MVWCVNQCIIDRSFSWLFVVFEVHKIFNCSSFNRSGVVSSFVHHIFDHYLGFFRPVKQGKVRSNQGKNLRVRGLSARVIEKILHADEILSLKLDAIL